MTKIRTTILNALKGLKPGQTTTIRGWNILRYSDARHFYFAEQSKDDIQCFASSGDLRVDAMTDFLYSKYWAILTPNKEPETHFKLDVRGKE